MRTREAGMTGEKYADRSIDELNLKTADKKVYEIELQTMSKKEKEQMQRGS